ncbi:type II toxin-antitoxin system VapB family antitoxin [Flindersiella endophytica]
MTDVPMRDVPDEVVARADATTKRLGLSRLDYLRRELLEAAAPAGRDVTEQDLIEFGETFADLGDPAVMGRSWA